MNKTKLNPIFSDIDLIRYFGNEVANILRKLEKDETLNGITMKVANHVVKVISIGDNKFLVSGNSYVTRTIRQSLSRFR